MKLKYWTDFSKRKNSTKQPLDTAAVEIDIKLKDDCSIINPVIQSSSIPINANYFYIADYGRYYYLDNTERTSNQLKDMACEVDTLATYKSYIGSTVAHIAYSSSGWDKWKVDNRIPVKTTKTVSHSSDSTAIFSGSGTFILTCVSDGSASGITAQFALTGASFRSLAQKLFTDQNIQDAIKKYLNSPFEAVVGCKWVPFSYDEVPGTAGTIEFGGESTGVSGKMLSSSPVRASSVALSIPWTYSDFRRSDPYTSLSIWLPGYGYTDLNASDVCDIASISCNFMCDCGTGNILYRIYDSTSSRLLTSGSYDASVNIPISSVSVDTGGIISNISGVISGAAGSGVAGALGHPAGALSSLGGVLGSGAGAILSANKRTASTRGSLSGRAIFGAGTDCVLYSFSVDTEDPDDASYIARWGRPVGVTHAISNHSGYVQCEGASVSMPGTATEKDRVNSYLNSGFFYE